MKVNLKQCGTQDRSAWRTLCHEAVTQFEDSRVEALAHKRAVRKGLNLAATSVLGYVTAALASAVRELDSTPINKLTDDMRSFIFDCAVRLYPFIRLCVLHNVSYLLISLYGYYSIGYFVSNDLMSDVSGFQLLHHRDLRYPLHVF